MLTDFVGATRLALKIKDLLHPQNLWVKDAIIDFEALGESPTKSVSISIIQILDPYYIT